MAERTLDEILVNLRRRVGHLERRLAKGGGGGNGGEAVGFRGTTAERDAMFPLPANDADRVSLANRQVWWFNTDKGWIEQYFAVTGKPGLNVVGVLPPPVANSGWFPLRGSMILGHKGMNFLNGTSQSPTGTVGYYTEEAQVLIGGVTNHDVYALVVPIAGFYRIRTSTHNWRESETLTITLWLNINNVKLARYTEGDVVRGGTQAFEVVVPVAAGAQIKTTYVTNASPYWGFTGEPEFGGWGGTMLDVQYEGPPLAGGVGMAWPPAR